MKNLTILITFILVISNQLSYGQKFVNEFLNIGVGARNQSMFGAVTSHVNDGTAALHNVAGLTGIKANMQINAMHSRWFGGVANFDYVTIARNLNTDARSVVALSVVRLGVDNIPNTLNLIGPDGSVDFSRVTSFSTSDLAAFVSYARELDENRLSIGGNIKVIRRSIGEFGDAWGVGADLGVQYKMNENLTFGLSARDITTTVNSWVFNIAEDDKRVLLETGNDVPVSSTEIALPRLVGGVGYKYKTETFSILGEANLNISTDGTEAGILSGNFVNVDPTFGFEGGYVDKVFLRAGLGNFQSTINPANTATRRFELQPNIGLGLKLGKLKIDYALANLGSVSGVQVSHIFSLGLDIVPRS